MSTLAQLRSRAQARADQQSSNFVTTAEWTDLINEAYLDLWDEVVGAFGDHFISSANFTLAGGYGGNTYTLPADFYFIRALYQNPDSDAELALEPFALEEKNRLLRLSYGVMGLQLWVLPEANAGGSYRMYYVPACPVLSADSDTVSSVVVQWEEYIVLGAAIAARSKEETDTADLERRQQKVLARLQALATRRDAGRPRHVGDVTRWNWPPRSIIPG